ncbi:MAG: sensor histidine kinase, partial [Hyphomicrobiaceae bacterium]
RLESAQQLEPASAALREKLDTAISDTDDILETFSALLRIAQIEAGTRKTGFAMLDLSEVVTNACDAYAPVLHDDQKVLELDVEAGIQLNGDRELLTQLIANLIENAVHHTPVGTTEHISLKLEQSTALLRVSDNGPGVPSDQRSRILDRFYRADQSRNTPGSGLGLSLVKAVSDLHRASVDLDDNNPGLVVEIRFPNITERVARETC